MKRQQSNFVVEIKGRRRSPAPVKSIWGSTDIGRLAREVAADAPHLFESGNSKEELVAPVAVPVPDAIANETDAETSADNIETSSDFCHSVPNEPIASPEPQSEPKKRRSYRRRSSTGFGSTSNLEVEPPQYVSDDVLQALYDENQRLLISLRDQLTKENEWLTRALDRYNRS